MNGNTFLDAMEGIRDRYILSAQERLWDLTPHKKSGRNSMKRIFTVALAAALALTCTMAVAMAVSPELRAAVISLFQLDEPEQVPGIPAGTNEVRQTTLGNTVTARYVNVDGSWSFSVEGGLLRKGSGWQRQGNQYYRLDGGTLTEVGTDAPVAELKVLWNGEEYAGRFRWFIHEGQLYLDDRFYEDGDYSKTPIGLAPHSLGKRTDVAVLSAMGYEEGETYYFWIYDLKSGQVRDVLADCGVETLGPTRWVQFSEDLKYAIVQAGETYEGTPYLADLKKRTCTPLSQLFGMEIKEFQIETGEGGYRAGFYGNDSILLAIGPKDTPWTDQNSVWSYHIPSGAAVCTVEDGRDLRPINGISGQYAQFGTLALAPEGDGVSIVDLGTGGRVKLEGVDTSRGFLCMADSTGAKLLWAEWDEVENNVSVRIDRLGVINLKTGIFTVFQREGLEELRNNEWAFWLSDNQVVVTVDPYNGAGYDPETRETYLCIYEF